MKISNVHAGCEGLAEAEALIDKIDIWDPFQILSDEAYDDICQQAELFNCTFDNNYDLVLDETAEMYNYRMFDNYPRVCSWPIVERSYEEPLKLFQLTFKPFDEGYDPDYPIMHAAKKYMWNQKHINLHAYVFTREILHCAKVHANAMIFSKDDLSYLHDKFTNHFKVYCRQIPMWDKYRLHNYIIKESKERFMFKYTDILIYPSADKNKTV